MKIVVTLFLILTSSVFSQPLGLVVHKDLTDSIWRYFQWNDGIESDRYEIILDKNNEKGYEYQDEIYFYFENPDDNHHFSQDTVRNDILQEIKRRTIIVPIVLPPKERIKKS